MHKKSALKKLNQEIRNCRKCPLGKTRINAVPGEGPVNAKIMFFGQAAGIEGTKTGFLYRKSREIFKSTFENCQS